MVAAGTVSAVEAHERTLAAPPRPVAPRLASQEPPLPGASVVETARESVRVALRAGAVKIAVVDDDPTGTQTVRDVPLLTSWTEGELEWAMRRADPLFAILTNSRSLPAARASAVNAEIGRLLPAIAARLCVGLRVISRSDSTLRGHFPAEVEALASGLRLAGDPVDCVLICPAFPEAGRVTIDGVHWVSSAGRLIPAGETYYARDAAFGYRSSRLAEWVKERAGAQVPVASITLRDIRDGSPERVAGLLRAARKNARYLVADAAAGCDLDLLACGVSLAEREGVKVLCRTGPSFLSARAGRAPAPPLAAQEIATSGGRGLVVVGSHTELTTAQLAQARARHELKVVMLDVEWLLADDGASCDQVVAHTVSQLRKALAHGDAALVTSRRLADAARGQRTLEAIATISDTLVAVVRQLAGQADLDWLIAKGGITSHDIATRALGATRATVLGQLFAGQVSVWELGEGSLCTGLRYVVFPGNVGDELTLADALDRLKGGS